MHSTVCPEIQRQAKFMNIVPFSLIFTAARCLCLILSIYGKIKINRTYQMGRGY